MTARNTYQAKPAQFPLLLYFERKGDADSTCDFHLLQSVSAGSGQSKDLTHTL